MPQTAKVFRVFVSSTFSDLLDERNALQENVFPLLRDYCKKNGARFQAIDLRWGVSEEASLDQQTMNICLEELHRCQQTTPRPNFIILLGERYGWCPLPPRIPASEFKMIHIQVKKPEEISLLDQWYCRDDNAIPPENCLQPRKLFIPENATVEYRKDAIESESDEWIQIERCLRSILLRSIYQLGWPIDDPRRIKYEASATHQEILEGALKADHVASSVYAYFRKIEDLPEDDRAKTYIDTKNNNLDREANVRLLSLKVKLKTSLPPGHVYEYAAKWQNGKPASDLQTFCARVEADLLSAIKDELFSVNRTSELDTKIKSTSENKEQRNESEPDEIFFNGHVETVKEEELFSASFAVTLQKIAHYLVIPSERPLAVFAESGAGAKILMAKAIKQAREQIPFGNIVFRFIGTTAHSLDGKTMLIELINQLCLCYGEDNKRIITQEQEIFAEFRKKLKLATEKAPIILFFDGLEELIGSDAIKRLDWLPIELSPHTYVVANIYPSKCLPWIKTKFSGQNKVHLHPKFIVQKRIDELLNDSLNSLGRTLQDEQRAQVLQTVNDAMKSHALPLYVRIFQKFAFEEVTKWHSYQRIPEYNGKIGFASDLQGILSDFLWRLTHTKKHDEVLVNRCLGYLIASRYQGLAEDELLDILSTDLDVYERFITSTFHSPPDFVACVRKNIPDLQTDDAMQSFSLSIDDQGLSKVISNLRQDTKRLRHFLTKIFTEDDAPRLPIVVWSRLQFDLSPYLSIQVADGTQILCLFHRRLSSFLEEEFLPVDEIRKCHRGLADYFQNQLLSLKGNIDQTAKPRIVAELEFQQRIIKSWENETN